MFPSEDSLSSYKFPPQPPNEQQFFPSSPPRTDIASPRSDFLKILNQNLDNQPCYPNYIFPASKSYPSQNGEATSPYTFPSNKPPRSIVTSSNDDLSTVRPIPQQPSSFSRQQSKSNDFSRRQFRPRVVEERKSRDFYREETRTKGLRSTASYGSFGSYESSRFPTPPSSAGRRPLERNLSGEIKVPSILLPKSRSK